MLLNVESHKRRGRLVRKPLIQSFYTGVLKLGKVWLRNPMIAMHIRKKKNIIAAKSLYET